MAKKDINGREYATLKDLKAGDIIQIDDGFTCALPWSKHNVKEVEGRLYFSCNKKFHGLDGQLDFEDHESLIGVYKL